MFKLWPRRAHLVIIAVLAARSSSARAGISFQVGPSNSRPLWLLRTAAIRASVDPRPGIPVSVFGYRENSQTADSKQLCLLLFYLSVMYDEHDPRILRV